MTDTNNKGVTVVALDPLSAYWAEKKHEGANMVAVKDSGQLLVQKRTANLPVTVAVYAPDRWASATVDEE